MSLASIEKKEPVKLISAEELRKAVKTRDQLEDEFVEKMVGVIMENINHLANLGAFQLPDSFSLTTSEDVLKRIINEFINNGYFVEFMESPDYGVDIKGLRKFYLMISWSEDGFERTLEEDLLEKEIIEEEDEDE